ERDRARGNGLDRGAHVVAEAHHRPLAVLLLDLSHDGLERLELLLVLLTVDVGDLSHATPSSSRVGRVHRRPLPALSDLPRCHDHTLGATSHNGPQPPCAVDTDAAGRAPLVVATRTRVRGREGYSDTPGRRVGSVVSAIER